MATCDAEAQPLLSTKPQVTPLPRAQLAIILFLRVVEPIAYTQLFPYINAMVEELGIAEPKHVGFYSGMIDSLFALTQLCTVVHWGGLSDRIGRKPVIIIGLSGVTIATVCFGLSSTLWQLLLSRALIGALCGNVAVINSAISDITDETNQSQGLSFPLLSVIWYIGAIIGPFLGGMLSHPAERYPRLFGAVPLLRERPFFLPCLTSGLITFTAILVAIFFMKETLPRLVKDRGQDIPDASPSRTSESAVQYPQPGPTESPSPGQVTTFGLLADRYVRRVVVMGFCMSFLLYAIESAIVIWSYTPLVLGGLQQEPTEIGAVLSILGILAIASTIIAFPYLHNRFKTVPLLTATLAMCGVVYASIPTVGFIIRKALPPIGQEEPGPSLGMLWAFVLCIMLTHNVAVMSYAAYMLVVKESISDSRSVGALFGLVTAAICLGEGTAPAFISSLFALSIDKQILGGNLVWLIMVCLSALGTLFSHFGLEKSAG
ncbi:hypothetical protein M407DRAFT_234198 [Tulasnella calospora MUT 4182]|uniref:Major facilitator superfamily (MFS) profile domain-containing protein n=1 Tax=Tulasnella calospora MUT 4182 TaxID=1051891 RepID=A0A0C3LZA6_9AGAM|nr:hypothetical protein M407DRAFT_234198 [Tulasnella calospora MUT 4182]